jgi:hypothetical protein
MEKAMRIFLGQRGLVLLLAVVFFMPATARAKESICDGLKRAAHGLCVAYCEGLDCDGSAGGPNTSLTACDRLWTRYEKAAGPGAVFPCEVPASSEPVCPCWLDEEQIFELTGDPVLCDAQFPEFFTLQGTKGIVHVTQEKGGPYRCELQGQDSVIGIEEPEAMACFADLAQASGELCGSN